MKTLQQQYNLIKEGKGNKELFIKDAKRHFPNIIGINNSYDQVLSELKRRHILSDSQIPQEKPETNFFKLFEAKMAEEENIKANLSKPNPNVVSKETAGFDFKDKENLDSLFGQQALIGFWSEMEDPKNKEKTVDEIRDIVFKNLKSDQLYYVKNGVFGVKGIGYTDNIPGFNAGKEVTGPYKSSGMEKVPLSESKKPKKKSLKENFNYKEGDIVNYNDEEHIIEIVYPDRIVIRPKADSVLLGRRNNFWVKPTDVTPAITETKDINDPVLMKIRAEKNKPSTQKSKSSPELEKLKKQKQQILSDMEEEAEPEGGPISDKYGAELDKIDAQIQKLEKKYLIKEDHLSSREDREKFIIKIYKDYISMADDNYLEIAKDLKLMDDSEVEELYHKAEAYLKKKGKDPKSIKLNEEIYDVDEDDYYKPDPNEDTPIKPVIDEYNEGFDANQKGKSKKTNPYTKSTSKWNKWNKGWDEAYNLTTVNLLGDEDEDLWENKIPSLKKIKESISTEQSGLIVIPDSEQDKELIETWLEDSDYYAEFDSINNYFFFPETPESYSELEQELQDQFITFNINANIKNIGNNNSDPLQESHDINTPGYDLIEKIKEDFGDDSEEYNIVEDIIFDNIDSETNTLTEQGIKMLYSYLEGIGVMDDIDYEEGMYNLATALK